jgi:hypothetical protein
MNENLIGRRVRITSDNLGAMPKAGGRMVERTFPAGTVATVAVKLPEDDRFKDWYGLEVDDDPTIYIPAHVSMFEPQDAASVAMDETLRRLP